MKSAPSDRAQTPSLGRARELTGTVKNASEMRSNGAQPLRPALLLAGVAS